MTKQGLTVLIVLIILILGGWFLLMNRKNDITEQGVFCTMEALICPDGSGVGRSGPKCEFKACPNQDAFSGRLIKQGDSYILRIAAPDPATGEVSYALPLVFSTSPTANLANQNVNVSGKFTAGNTLAVDKIEKLNDTEATTAEIKVGETKYVNGVRIKVNKIVEDSRCPLGVFCIQAGKLVAEVVLQSDTDKETTNLTLAGKAYSFDAFKISLIEAAPLKRAGEVILPADYKLIFQVK